MEVIGAGSSGATSASALSRLKWHLKKKPDLLILALGANDGLRGVKLSATKDNLARTIDLAKQNQIKVFLAGMKIPMNYGEDYRREFESLYQSLVKEKQIGLIPFLLEGVAAEPKYNLADGIHPNEEGHKIIAQNIFSQLKDHL